MSAPRRPEPTRTNPDVTRVVEDEAYHVQLDLAPLAGVLLEALAKAVHPGRTSYHEWFILGANTSDNPARRELAVRELLADKGVQAALRVALHPEAAEELAAMLDEAQLEPKRCAEVLYAGSLRSPEPAEGCDNYAQDGTNHCTRHAPADDMVEAYGL